MPHRNVPLKAALLFVLAILGIASTLSATRSAASTLVSASTVYLPIVRVAPPAPQLLTPADGDTTSLAPILSWTLPYTGTYQVQVATDPTFATTVVNKSVKYTNPSVTTGSILSDNSNLDQQTLFFWRVGVVLDGVSTYSSVRTFTTPKESSETVSAGPVLGQAVPLTNSVTMNWEEVPGALYYRVNVDSDIQKGVESEVLTAPATTATIRNLTPGTTYTWRVRALTATGWSKDAKGPAFTTQP